MNITNVCTLSESTIAAGNYLLIQCDAEEAPVATPTAAPTAVPTTTPTTTPTTPTARPVATPSNSASALAAGGLFFVVALML
jgi:cell division septation protein DedD